MRVVSSVVIGTSAATAVLLISVAHFLWIVDRDADAAAVRADAIVALSGDPSRISRAVALLAAGHGSRLFIAGVDNGDEIERQTKRYPDLFACCVEVEHESMTTHEDAAAIAAWAKRRNVTSLLVVTSVSHLPRALVEVHDALPGVTLVSSGVTKGMIDFTDWRTDPSLWRVLAREYVKTIGTLLANRFPLLKTLIATPEADGSGRSG